MTNNTTAPALTDEQHIIEMAAKHGIGPTSGLGFARALLTSPRAAGLPAPDLYWFGDHEHGFECPDDAAIVHGRKLGERFTLKASWYADMLFEVTKVPDDNDDDYEVRAVAAAPAAPVAEYDGNHVQNHCTECNEHEAECTCTAAVAADGAAKRVADGLEACDWSGVPIGNKAIIKHAISLLRAAVSPATADERAAPGDWREAFNERHEFDIYPDDFMTGLRNEFAAGWYAALKTVGASQAAAPADAREPFQARVQPWMLECFGPTIAADRIERNHRFLEEALELVQALGCTASEAHQLVDYTFGRPAGDPDQEVGGVMVTLAALCLANTLDMHQAGETELGRISEPATVLKIRAKQAAKPKHSPLPQAVAARAPYEWRDTGPLETDEGGAA
ncbi:hypothetical protein [Burkholderia glumae]|uniref:hypothetical protein n=1 Tax=Burkholderia glumae TaxID=337 RepID=UPI0021516457|nr:hypothetical protein [Burkholderia glumae]